EQLGFTNVRTYIASGNVVFQSKLPEAKVKAALKKRMATYAGKPVDVLIRTASELAAIVKANPFPERAPNATVAIFLDSPPPADTIKLATGLHDEEIRLGKREIYVHYGAGMGTSRLKIPAAKNGTARNINTIAKLAEMAAKLEA
ncbi:MAG TPA: DUF1697 domain-containing protein, partial [Acidisarcina sp.]